MGAYTNVAGYKTVPYFPAETNVELREEDHIHEWEPWQQVTSGNYVLNDYDFEKPKANLTVKSTDPKDYAYAEFEQYDYPGEYLVNPEGDKFVSSRLQELHAHSVGVSGSGNVRGMTNATLFNLENYPVDGQNREHLVTSTDFFLQSDAYLSSGSSESVECRCGIDSRQRFVPERTTPRPVVQGPQTAVVVGPAGEEIYTDKYGRVKVQFHWDREGKMDENSSCWIRVSHPTAGKNWGGVQIPRIGQEVIVNFLEGDPDQPIITGRVYNAGQMPPFDLPSKKMVSGMKSNSTPGGGGYNEFSLDDTKGNELITVHGQFDMDSTIENDLREHVLHDRSRDVTHNETIQIGNDQTSTIGNNRTEQVVSNETVSIGSNRAVTIGANKTETVAINKAETIGVAKELTIGGLYQVSVGGVMNETVALAKAQEVGATKTTAVAGNVSETYKSSQSTNVSKDHTESIGKNQSITVGENQTTSVGKDQSVKVGKNLVIDAGDSVLIKTGKASIAMKKDGTITIEGKDITIKGSGAINVKASKNITMKGQKILEN
ncbi:MAG: type VI secretion system tip protein VgrG [Methylococcaceae bacterium]|nr:type VI secretion system tip protein VgrG [Methylococcaceae bacterium]